MSGARGARLSIVVAAVLFSTGGAAIKATELSAMQVSCARSGIAALVLALAMKPWRRRLPMRVWWVGVGYASVVTLFVISNKLTTSAHTIYLQSTAPLFVLALSPWLQGARVQRRDLSAAAVLLVGIALLIAGTPAAFATAPAPALGNSLAVLAGFCWALTLIGLSTLEASAPPNMSPALDAAFAGNLIACLVALPFALPVASFTGTDLLGVSYLGVVQTALAYLILVRGVRQLPALEISLLLLIEPVLNPFWAWWLHGETLSFIALTGCALVLGASARLAFGSRPAQGQD